MVLYSCPRCGYTSNIRTKMRSHFKRKNICSPTCSDVPIEECFEEVLGEKIPEVSQKYHKSITKVSQRYHKVNALYVKIVVKPSIRRTIFIDIRSIIVR